MFSRIRSAHDAPHHNVEPGTEDEVSQLAAHTSAQTGDLWGSDNMWRGHSSRTERCPVPQRAVFRFRCCYQNSPPGRPSAASSGIWALTGIQSALENNQLHRSSTVSTWHCSLTTAVSRNETCNYCFTEDSKEGLKTTFKASVSQISFLFFGINFYRSQTPFLISAVRRYKMWFMISRWRSVSGWRCNSLVFTAQISTWEPHGANVHICALTWRSSHTSWQGTKWLPENRKLPAGEGVVLVKLERTSCPWRDLSKTWNSRWNSIIHNPLLIYNPARIRPHSIRFFFSPPHQCRDLTA